MFFPFENWFTLARVLNKYIYMKLQCFVVNLIFGRKKVKIIDKYILIVNQERNFNILKLWLGPKYYHLSSVSYKISMIWLFKMIFLIDFFFLKE